MQHIIEVKQVEVHGSLKRKCQKLWQVHYKKLTFNIKPMGFKHTGLFPEQAVNWDWMINKIEQEKQRKQKEK